jgi:hypothetical protein
MGDSQSLAERNAIPPELDRWNWGAFLLNWVWGVGNNTFIALLTLIPFVGLVMPFVLGAKGSRWAWRNGRWDSVAHFKRVQRLWAIWGVVIWLGMIALFGAALGSVFYFLKHSEAYRIGVAQLQENPVAAKLLGAPISTGYPTGSIFVNKNSGKAALNFSASGPVASGTVYLEAIKKDDVWSIVRLALKLKGSERFIDLINGAKPNST